MCSIVEVIDDSNNVHKYNQSAKPLGEGGQGIVYRSLNPDLAIKIERQNGVETTDKQQIEDFHKKIRNIRLLQLEDDIKISLPLTLLKDHAGYVMKLLNSARSCEFFLETNCHLTNLTNHTFTVCNDTVGTDVTTVGPNESCKFPSSCNDVLKRYAMSGGLRLRNITLANTASIISRLHGRSLIYADISHNNVFFIADNAFRSTVWLIDADNLIYEKKQTMSVFTPGYAAPEVAQKVDGVRPQSDCHAFSVLAFKMLCWVHPFLGLLSKPTDDEDDWGSDGSTLGAEDRCYAGINPYIDDPNDRSNAEEVINQAFPRKIMLTKLQQKLFEVTFCKGRINPGLRPSIYHHVRAHAKASEEMVCCQHCGMSLAYDFNDDVYTCKCCDRQMQYPFGIFVLKSFWYTGKKEDKTAYKWVREVDLSKDFEISVPVRVFDIFDNRNFDEDCLYISHKKDKSFITIQKNMDSEISLSYANKSFKNGKFNDLGNGSHIVDFKDMIMRDQIWLLSKNKDSLYKVISFLFIGGNGNAFIGD